MEFKGKWYGLVPDEITIPLKKEKAWEFKEKLKAERLQF